MKQEKKPIRNVPTNIITGFLGVGKTSAVLHLLESKPVDERWAVLVNEFGEVGVDGSLFGGQASEEGGVFIQEVPGGCMCCAVGVPMRVALIRLLSRSRPDRLLIEPTGLGHPKEVLRVLADAHFRKVLSIQQVITLVDARKLADSRYTEHETFNQQIEIADIVVGNKTDLYREEDRAALERYVRKQAPSCTQVRFAQHGALDLTWLRGETRTNTDGTKIPQHSHDHEPAKEARIPESGLLRTHSEGEGFQSVGWRFAPDRVFDRRKLLLFVHALKVERLKGVVITEDGIFALNATEDGLFEHPLDECSESRIEWIAREVDPDWESQLLACMES